MPEDDAERNNGVYESDDLEIDSNDYQENHEPCRIHSSRVQCNRHEMITALARTEIAPG